MQGCRTSFPSLYSPPILFIHHSVADRLRKMLRPDSVFPCQICNRPGNLQDFMISSCRKLHPVKHLAHHPFPFAVKFTVFFYLCCCNPRIKRKFCSCKSLSLYLSCLHDSFAYVCRRFSLWFPL